MFKVHEIQIDEDFVRDIVAGKMESDRVFNPFGRHLEIRHSSGSYGSVELRFYELPGEDGLLRTWRGPSVTVYRPEVEFGGDVKGAYVSHSSGGSNDTLLDTEIAIWLLCLAHDIATGMDEADAPRMAAEIAEYKRHREEYEEQRVRLQELSERRAEWAREGGLDGRQVRIETPMGRLITGTMRLDEDGKFLLAGDAYAWHWIKSLAVKPLGSKYAPYQRQSLPD